MEDKKKKKKVSAKKFTKKLKKGMKSNTAKSTAAKKPTGLKLTEGRDLTTPLAESVMTKTFITSPKNVKWKEKYK